ncbi:hypothetical protein ACLMAL_36485 (plasmid) [Nocardia sp. CWNU-33]|uniref:hypothetical protein n=1 Tax=Nocardia sp. CWNU-33 TaxID=3392117 RepID=UPI00398F1CA9
MPARSISDDTEYPVDESLRTALISTTYQFIELTDIELHAILALQAVPQNRIQLRLKGHLQQEIVLRCRTRLDTDLIKQKRCTQHSRRAKATSFGPVADYPSIDQAADIDPLLLTEASDPSNQTARPGARVTVGLVTDKQLTQPGRRTRE